MIWRRLAAAVLIGGSLTIGSSAATGSAAAPGPGLIAFAGVRWSNCCVTSQIYVIRADGKGQRRLSGAGAWQDSSPAWSRNGQWIAFGRSRLPDWVLYVMDASGGHLHAITKPMALADNPAWSQDGRSIVFAGMPKPVPRNFAQQLYITASGGGAARQLTHYSLFRGGAGNPSWSPDGKLILFAASTSSLEGARSDVWVIRPNGSGLRRLISGATDPAWSPDGKRIAFVRSRQIYVATAAGRDVRRLTQTKTEKSDPNWSPDGTRIVFSNTHRYADPDRDDDRLAIIAANGTGFREITDTSPNFWAAAPSWQPAG